MDKRKMPVAIKTNLYRETINQIFDEVEKICPNPHQQTVLLKLYEAVFGKTWEEIEKVHGWPKCSKNVWDHCCLKFREFDRKYHPKVMAGGLWLNSGFSCDEKIQDWIVIFDGKVDWA